MRSGYSKKDAKRDVESMKFDQENNAISLGFFWGTMLSKKGQRPLDVVTREAYDKTISRLYCDFARTVLKLQKEKKNSKVWRLLVDNAKMQIRWQKKKRI